MVPTSFHMRVRRRDVLIAVALLVIFWLLTPFWQYSPAPVPAHRISIKKKENYQPQQELWRGLHLLLSQYHPEVALPANAVSPSPIEYNATHERSLLGLSSIPQPDVDKMRDAHRDFVKGIKADATRPSLHYEPGTRGIVTAVSSGDLPVLLVSLRMIRRTHTVLPVEVFIMSEEEYESEICEEVLPLLNATCVAMSDIMRAKDVEDVQYAQLRSLAMLFSTFEDILWLDPDCFPLRDPSHVFRSEIYHSTGLTIWPALRTVTTSPLYYDISSQRVPLLTERVSTETGGLFLSRNKHCLTLLLASYYNYYGPSHYYSLLSQNAPEDGGRETLLAAASALRIPYHMATEQVRQIGYPTVDGDIAGSAIVQYDPVRDPDLVTQGRLQQKKETGTLSPRALFLHARSAGQGPATDFDPFNAQLTQSPDDKWSRIWKAPEEVMHSIGYHTEIHFWEEVQWVACTHGHRFQSWKNKWGVCERVTHSSNNLFAGVHSTLEERPLF